MTCSLGGDGLVWILAGLSRVAFCSGLGVLRRVGFFFACFVGSAGNCPLTLVYLQSELAFAACSAGCTLPASRHWAVALGCALCQTFLASVRGCGV